MIENMNQLTTSEKILVLSKRKGMDLQDIAAEIGTKTNAPCTPQSLSYRMRENSWSVNLLEHIAEILQVSVKDLV
jgi:transcriptional regulator with XRE-family HTH domain